MFLYIICVCSFALGRAQDNSQYSKELIFEEISIAHNDGLQSWENIDVFYEDENGIIWSIIDDGLYRFNGHSAINVTKYLTKFHKLNLENQPGTQFLISDKTIWYGLRKGLHKINLNTLSSNKIYIDEPSFPSDWRNYIQDLKEYKDTLYVGTANGLYLINKTTHNVISKYLNDGFDIQHRESSNSVESIFPNIEKNAIWVTLSKGLFRIDKTDQSIEEYTIKNAPYSFPHNFHSGKLYGDILLMPSHGLGMVEFNLKTKQFANFLTNPEQAYIREENVIRSAIKLNDSLVLVNAVKLGNGLFNRYTKKYQWLETDNILKEGVFLNLDRSGYVWASKRGRIFRSENPVIAHKLPYKHMLDISSFKSNDVLKNSPSIEGYTPIQLDENERNIDLEFSIKKPYVLDSIRYEYKLDSRIWQPIKTNNELKLFDLSYGNHRLSIRALYADGKVISSRGVDFKINLPFYKSPYFIASGLVLVLVLIYGLERYRNQQKTHAKFKELDTLKSNFFANISHEFRTPLSLILSPIDDALNDESISEHKRRQFMIAKQNSERLLSLVNQLLDLSKIDAGHLKLHLQNGKLLHHIAALCQSFSYYAKQKRINYEINVEQTEHIVWFDKDAIEKIIVNLLSNALKYTPENGTVVCNANINANKLVLEVKNNGKGISEQELNTIFERFYQTDEQNQGTGIGLALTKELVELHKGSIEVTSEPNEWTSFKVILSIDKNSFNNVTILTNPNTDVTVDIPLHIEHPIDEHEDFVDSEQPILLIVEDNNDLRNLLKQTFADHYNVMTAANGAIGVESALEHIPDLIISDIMMPEKDGFALTYELKNDERTSHIPIILLTAKAGDETKLESIVSGADDFITKPFNSKILSAKVSKLIEIRRKLQSRYSQEIILRPKDIAITNLDELFLEKVQDVLDTYLMESSFSIEDFSRAVGMSRMQLHRKIKALTGLSASEFIRSQRLKLAAQLLKKSDINISQVGYTIGFNDHAYFSKCFKKDYKCTPTEYAKKQV